MKFLGKREAKIGEGKILDPRSKGPIIVKRQEAMATAEYAIVTLAAVGLAGLLVLILKSDEVRGLLTNIIVGALSSFSAQ